VDAQRSWGLADVELLDGGDARRRFPYLGKNVVNARYRQGDGWLEPRRLALELARASGSHFRLGETVIGFERDDDGMVVGVITDRGKIRGDVVIAAGPLSAPLAKLAGLDLPLATVRRQKLIIPDLPQVPAEAPMTIEFETGAHWRPAGTGAHALWTAPAPAELPQDDVPTSNDFAFGLLDPSSDHAYTPDRRPLLGPTEIPGLAVNTGYSGHGIMGSIGGSRRALDAIYGRLKPQDNPFRPDRAMEARAFDVL